VRALGHRVLRVGLGDDEVVPERERPGAIGRLDPERLEQRVEEALGGRTVRDADGDVVEHAPKHVRNRGFRVLVP
jgi:hypothetical protein